MNSLPTADPLAGLRGYHLPAPVHWWPPAPGWWILAGLLAILTGILVLVLVRRRRRLRSLRVALAELDELLRDDAGLDPGDFARRLSRLLRRYALVRFPRRQVAGLTGEAWLRFLDAHAGQPGFSAGAGRLLRDAPYRPDCDPLALRELAQLARAWMLHNAEVRS
jgi:hypothetical protein